MKKIVVTGGTGMIGSNMIKRLVKEGNEVFVIDNLWRGKLDYLNNDEGTLIIPLDARFF
jgi:GDP-D-mannose 3', 5'-epimerase